MSRTRHARGKRAEFFDHLRKEKEWKGDSTWRPGERSHIDTAPRTERRSPRTRLTK